MKKVIIFTIVTMTAVLMLTAASFGQRRGSFDGYQGRRATSVWVERQVTREYRPVYRGGFQRDYPSPFDQIRRERELEMMRLRSLRYEIEARRAARFDRAIRREARERDFIYSRRLRDRVRY